MISGFMKDFQTRIITVRDVKEKGILSKAPGQGFVKTAALKRLLIQQEADRLYSIPPSIIRYKVDDAFIASSKEQLFSVRLTRDVIKSI